MALCRRLSLTFLVCSAICRQCIVAASQVIELRKVGASCQYYQTSGETSAGAAAHLRSDVDDALVDGGRWAPLSAAVQSHGSALAACPGKQLLRCALTTLRAEQCTQRPVREQLWRRDCVNAPREGLCVCVYATSAYLSTIGDQSTADFARGPPCSSAAETARPRLQWSLARQPGRPV